MTPFVTSEQIKRDLVKQMSSAASVAAKVYLSPKEGWTWLPAEYSQRAVWYYQTTWLKGASMADSIQRFLGELRRRNVLRVGAAFLIGGWVVLQVVDILGPATGMPDWVIIVVASIIAAGLPVALMVAWYFEITPSGFVPTNEVPFEESITHATGSRIDRIIIVLLAAALSFFVGEYLYRSLTQDSDLPTNAPLSLAVVPLGSPSEAFELVNQLSLEISRALAAVPDLPITPQEVVNSLKTRDSPDAAASELGVRYLLLFDMPQSDGRITARLYDVANAESNWQATFDPSEDDALVFQQTVSRNVAQELGVLTTAEAESLFALPTQSSEAYALYLRGLQLLDSLSDEPSRSEAEQAFTKALTLDPSFALAYAGLCRIELARYSDEREVGRFESAERHCHRALTLGRYKGEVYIALGDLYIASGQSKRAEESYREALRINPSYISAVLGLASALHKQGDAVNAERVFLRAIRAQPGYYLPYNRVAAHYIETSDFLKARENLVFASQLAPNNPMVLNNIGATYALTGDFEEASDLFKRSLALSPNDPWATSNLGSMYFFQGRYQDARALNEKAVQQTPYDGRKWRNLGDALIALGDHRAAEDAFRHAIELLEAGVSINPKEEWFLGSLAVAYASVGETEKLNTTIGRLLDTPQLDSATEYDVAVALCRLNRFDECLEYAHRAAENDFPMAMIAADPDLAPIVERLNVAS
jgi:tetratricopeptide (TPR) repeat protein